MDNNYNKMEYNIEESQKRKERQEKVDNAKKKVSNFFDRIKEDREERKRMKEEKARVKEQEQVAQQPYMSNSSAPSNGGFSEFTVTNETISRPSLTKKAKPVLSAQEKRRRKKKINKIIRNIMTIPEIIGIVYLALFLKDKYLDYSKDVHQVLTYSSGVYQYEIHRDNQDIEVEKRKRKVCATDSCDYEKVSEYEIQFGKHQMSALRIFMDIEFKLKSKSKKITYEDLKTEFGKRCIYAMIHNHDNFLTFSTYNKYTLIDFEQMGSYTQKGYKYNSKILSISMGEKPSSGYTLVVNSIYKKGDDLYVFIQEQEPDGTASTIITHPLIKIQLEEEPKNIYVYNIESGDEYPNFDVPDVPNPQPSMVQNREKISGIVGDLVGALKDDLLKG